MSLSDKPFVMFNTNPDLDRGPRHAALLLVGSLAVFLVIALVWMSFAKLDISVHAMGSVIPSSRVQNIQSLEGGIVRAIAVREGQRVKRGDLLAYVENLQYDAELGEGQQSYWAAQAARERLKAELSGGTPNFSPELQARAPAVLDEQRRLWLSRKQEYEASIATSRNQITQRQRELAEARTRVESLTALLAPLLEVLAMEEKLLSQGAGARADMLAAQREVTRIKGDLAGARIAIGRLQAALAEGESKQRALESKYRAEASRELNELNGKTAVLSEQLTAQRDRVHRREIRSPMDGVVNRVLINTVGGVAKAGETIMELVPGEDTLLIVARVKPSEIAFIRSGQKATVRISAYDSSIFGSLEGAVVRVGADAVLDEQKNAYFEVFLETQHNYLGKPAEGLTISPGMSADASIHTGQRTLMEYMLKPIVKTFDTALRER